MTGFNTASNYLVTELSKACDKIDVADYRDFRDNLVDRFWAMNASIMASKAGNQLTKPWAISFQRAEKHSTPSCDDGGALCVMRS